MPKRKRSSGSSIQEKLEKCRNDVARALKLAKAFERQRMNKRLHDDGITDEKKERLDREIAVLKVRPGTMRGDCLRMTLCLL